MSRTSRLLLGPLAVLLFLVGTIVLGRLVPGYDPIRQTVSEVGEVGSPMQHAFTALLGVIALCLAGFALAVHGVLASAGRSRIAAYLIGCMAISTAGVGYFSFPHPLHNVFGMSELVGYQAPLAFALAWRNDPKAKGMVAATWFLYALLWAAIVLNIVSVPALRPIHGLVQRSLFLAFFAWCAAAGLALWRRERASA